MVVGLTLSLPAFIYNISRSLSCFTRMTLAKMYLRLEGMWAGREVLEDFLASFSISLEVPFITLIKLGHEKSEALHQQVRDGDLHVFMGLAQVLEAFALCFAPPGTIYLASGKSLREYSSDVALSDFDNIRNLKNNSGFADFLTKVIPDMAKSGSLMRNQGGIKLDTCERMQTELLRALYALNRERRIRTSKKFSADRSSAAVRRVLGL